jgi:hypothetical protein
MEEAIKELCENGVNFQYCDSRDGWELSNGPMTY